ncbi:uncharacterized protein LOC123315034 [Coccinella septempunctata]|uniref:uncharacterized protein LOC123315034 n=1 Tax=Coccinella septempunctata TaxID=41139 RepID=UPI001D06F500|nr:uncharacterized protein LOC123315034 [Coccinella septempunctata]XP_044756519.1 uncharacterized protein LOC123315034 [Coccinella septempunctata]
MDATLVNNKYKGFIPYAPVHDGVDELKEHSSITDENQYALDTPGRNKDESYVRAKTSGVARGNGMPDSNGLEYNRPEENTMAETPGITGGNGMPESKVKGVERQENKKATMPGFTEGNGMPGSNFDIVDTPDKGSKRPKRNITKPARFRQ